MEWPHLLDNALKAHQLYKRDVNYVVREGQVIIVDEFTGRLMEGRQWSDGLHQAVEAKEGVSIKEETQTLATITLQNFFKLYKKISGMTGTAMTEAGEFSKIYSLGVVAIPSNRGLQRIEYPDAIYLTEQEKFNAIADEVERVNKFDTVFFQDKKRGYLIGNIQSETDTEIVLKKSDKSGVESIAKSDIERIEFSGRPILVGTVSIEKSEKLAKLLDQRGVKVAVLNAKQHRREAEIIAQAGRMEAVTIATNMAGRGTDIILGGNPETMAWAQLQDRYPTRLEVPKEEWETLINQIDEQEQMKVQGVKVREKGGLYVIGTERHESRRIDLQLRGRCGRQGDPGSSRFYLSLEDDLMRIFAGEWVRDLFKRMGMGNGEAIESPYVSKRISGAQKKVEERNFEIRKNLLEYDEVMDYQRKKVYGYRQDILEGASCRDLVMKHLSEQIATNVTQFMDPLFGPESFAKWCGARLGVQLEPKDFRGVEANVAEIYAKDQAQRIAETQILDAIDENLPRETEEAEWNWEAMTKWANNRFNSKFSISELKRIPRDSMDEHLIDVASKYIDSIDLSEGYPYLDDAFGYKSLVGWMANKFDIQVSSDELRGLENDSITAKLLARSEETYAERECQFPVILSFRRFSVSTGQNEFSIDGTALVTWATARFEDTTVLQQLSDNPDKAFELLVEVARASIKKGLQMREVVTKKTDDVFGSNEKSLLREVLSHSESRIDEVDSWARETVFWNGHKSDLSTWTKKQFETKMLQAIDDKFFPEIRRMERTVLLTQLDSAWKEHLLAMDHVRSSVGLRGMGQMDPKVEYKREGMRLFDQMWLSIGERLTDVIFRMEAMDADIIADSWVEATARHDEFDLRKMMQNQQPTMMEEKQRDLEAAEKAGQSSDEPIQPIRNRGSRVGRNDPCPCGSGKKYKNCCMRQQL
jgi:preprotein translocase subunit SecA